MNKTVRFGISLDSELLKRFDKYINKEKYTNRSEAIRDLIREQLIRLQWQKGETIIGVISLVYDHHLREVVSKIIDIQHDFPHRIIASQHVHMDHHNCLEVIIAEGKPEQVKQLASSLKALKGVKHCVFTPTTTGKELK